MADIKLKLTKTDSTEYEINRFNGLKSVESLSQSTPDAKTLSYGILNNTGNIKIIDENKNIANMVVNNQLKIDSGIVSIYANNKLIQKHTMQSPQYNEESIFTADLSDSMKIFDSFYFSSYEYSISNMYDLLKYCLVSCGYTILQIDAMLSNNITYGIDNTYGTVKQYLTAIKLGDISFSNIKCSEMINKICEVCQLVFIIADNGDKKFLSARPTINQNNTIIKIPTSVQYSKLKYNLIPGTKIESVSAQEYYSYIQEIDLPTTLSAITDKTKGIYISTPIINRGDLSKLPSNYTYEYYNSYRWLILTFKANGLKNKDFNKIEPLSESFGFLRWTTNPITSISSISDLDRTEPFEELHYYSNLEDFKTDIPTSGNSTMLVCGMKDSIDFNNDRTIYLAVRTDNGDVINTIFAVMLGADAELTYIDKQTTTTLYGDSSAKNNISFDNELFLTTNYIQETSNTKLSELFSTNIIDDYENGIRNGNITISCSNLYDTNNNLSKNWNNGEILQVGDYVKVFSKDEQNSPTSNIKWKVTGRNFRYAGCPYVDLELQEVRQI